jgi:hypothetical protein
MSDTPAENQTAPIVDENQLIAERRSKLKAMREAQKEGNIMLYRRSKTDS